MIALSPAFWVPLLILVIIVLLIQFFAAAFAWIDGDIDGEWGGRANDTHKSWRRDIYEFARERAVKRRAARRLRIAQNARERAAQARTTHNQPGHPDDWDNA